LNNWINGLVIISLEFWENFLSSVRN
jgi:hypothetical protein